MRGSTAKMLRKVAVRMAAGVPKLQHLYYRQFKQSWREMNKHERTEFRRRVRSI